MTDYPPDPDFATDDPVAWLTQLDRAADAMFREQVQDGYYTDACRGLLHHLEHTEHVRGGLLLENGPLFGTGPAPDFDVAWETTRISIESGWHQLVAEPRQSRIEELMQP